MQGGAAKNRRDFRSDRKLDSKINGRISATLGAAHNALAARRGLA
jgi:hypothetical protein